MYCAYITTLKGLRKHSNADRLQCVEVFGQNVIVDLSYQEGQKVVFFPSDGQLSLEYTTDNNLVRKKDENGNNIGGYMDAEKRNVTAIRLRGEKSEGLILPVETLSKYTDISKLKMVIRLQSLVVMRFVRNIFQEERIVQEVMEMVQIRRTSFRKKQYHTHFLKSIKILHSLHIICQHLSQVTRFILLVSSTEHQLVL